MRSEIEKVIDRFDQICQEETMESVAMEKRVHKPVWECGGEYYSEFDCFFIKEIGDRSGLTVNELQKIWGRTQGAVSQRLVAFEKRGLITREKCELDRRRTEVRLTEKGKSVYEYVSGLKQKHARDAIEVLLEHGYSTEDISKWLDMYEALAEYGRDCIMRVWS